MNRRARGAVVLAGAVAIACTAPGGAVRGRIMTETRAPIARAQVNIDFRDGTSFAATSDETGSYGSLWFHGTWKGTLVHASALGAQSAEVIIGLGVWNCDFTLAPAAAPPGTSKATCSMAEE